MMAEILFRDASDKDAIIDEIEAQARDEAQSGAFGGGNGAA
jgi:hypothetical protein